jgi:inner membrane protein
MPTILSHPAVPLALGIGLGARVVPPRLLVAGIVASVVPDLDVLAFRWGVPYDATWGHRGASHSIAFALLLGLGAVLLAPRLQAQRLTACSFVALAAASHGLLDMLTNGGRGVALLWPLSTERFFFPWRVIEVSPLSLRRLLDGRGLEVLQSELLWIWLPAGLACGLLMLFCRRSGVRKGKDEPRTRAR